MRRSKKKQDYEPEDAYSKVAKIEYNAAELRQMFKGFYEAMRDTRWASEPRDPKTGLPYAEDDYVDFLRRWMPAYQRFMGTGSRPGDRYDLTWRNHQGFMGHLKMALQAVNDYGLICDSTCKAQPWLCPHGGIAYLMNKVLIDFMKLAPKAITSKVADIQPVVVPPQPTNNRYGGGGGDPLMLEAKREEPQT